MKKKLYIFIISILGVFSIQAQNILGPTLNRKALVGPDCVIDKIINVVGVSSGINDLNNLMDEDLDNFATFVQVASVGVAVNPIISVKDSKYTYAASTTAGFCIVAGSNNSLLSLDVVKAMSIMVYKDGELKEILANKEGQNASVLGLNLIQIPGSTDVVINLTVQPTVEFDEIGLVYNGGVNLSVVNSLSIKYAFVGDPVQYNLTTSDMAKIGATVSAEGWNPVLLGIPFPLLSSERNKLIDDDLTNGATLTPILAAGYQGGIKLTTDHTFPAGTEVGFKSLNAGLLNLQAGAWVKIKLYNASGDIVQEESFNASVLGLAVGSGGTSTTSIVSEVAFCKAELSMYTVLAVNLSASIVYYGFVREKPAVSHQCNLRLNMNTTLCEGQSYYQLVSNPDISVEWLLEKAPEGSDVTLSTEGVVKNMDIKGDYIFRATAGDGCSETVTISKGVLVEESNCENPVYGENVELSTETYGSSGSLISISDLNNSENIIDSDFNNYAEYTAGLSIAENLRIVGVKKTDGTTLNDTKTAKRVGFILEAAMSGLGADVLQFFQIRLYKRGIETFRKVVDETNAISVGLIGSDQSLKTRYSISVPADVEFDEIMLWKSGVLNLNISTLRIYSAFTEEELNNCGDLMGCSTTLLSQNSTGMGYNYNETKQIGVLSVASVISNLGYLIDDDINTATIINGITVGSESVIALKTGRTLDRSHQLGIVVDKNTYLAGVTAGSWLAVETYYRGIKTVDEFTNWNVLGLDVIGYGDKSLMMMHPTMPYDEVRLTLFGIASVLDEKKIYGIFVRSDIDGDGFPDCKDPESCHDDITEISINPICENGTILISGKGYLNTPYTLIMSEQSKQISFKTSDQDGSFKVEIENISVVGNFNCIIKDGSDNVVANVPYTVHPLETRWRTDATDADWNNWNNWTNGSPYCCTDVIIPSNANYYPILDKQTDEIDENCCNNIHFEPNAEVVKTNSLTYNKAWVELELFPNRYYMLSAPLKNMYTGDMFIPFAMYGVQDNDYFTNLDATSSPESRYNPRVYQRLWSTTAPGKLLNDGYIPLSITETRWSRHFNALKYNYDMAKGLSLWVDNCSLSADIPFKFRFPKEHSQYTYYDDLGNQTTVTETNIDRSKSGRFIYEDVNDGSNIFPLSVTVTNEGDASIYFLVGNPFMSHINIQKFLEKNSDLKSVKVYDGNTNNSIISVDGELISNGESLGQIAPMQSFFVEKNEASTSLSVIFTEEMLEVSKESVQKNKLENELLKINVKSNIYEASTIIADKRMYPNFGQGTEALFDNEIKPSLAIFSMEGDNAYDILTVDDIKEIPLGIYVNIMDTVIFNFQTNSSIELNDYILFDKETGINYPIKDAIVLPDIQSSLGRFVLRQQSIINTESIDYNEIYVSTVARNAIIKSNYPNINLVDVYDMLGKKHHSQKISGVNEVNIPINNGINIIKVTLTDKTVRSFKIIGYN